MKRLSLIVLVLAVLAAIGAHWHVVGQTDERLGRLATLLAPIGQLSWASVLVDPRGSVSVNELRFQPHDNRDRLSIERLIIDAGNLRALLMLDRELDNQRLPDTLNIVIEGLKLPVNRQLDGWIGTLVPSLPFASAGCPLIDPLTFYKLGELGWWDVTLDAQIEYQRVNLGEALELRARLHAHQMAEGQLHLRLALPPEQLALDRAEPLGQGIALELAQLTLANRGFYERLSEVCAGRIGITDEQFRARHLKAWEARWQASGLQPRTLVLAGYRHFLNQPETLAIALEPDPPIDLMRLAALPIQQQLPRLDAQFSINGGTEIDLRLNSTGTRSSSPPAGPPPPPVPEPSEPARPEIVPDAPEANLDIDLGPAPEWRAIGKDRINEHIGSRIAIELSDGSRYSGRLVDVDETNLHISIHNRLGQLVRPVPRSEVQRIEIKP